MLKPQNWEQVEATKEFGAFESLKLGGHVVVIKKAFEYTGQTGNTSLRIEVDIADGEQKGFFQKQYDNNQAIDRRWSNGAIKYMTLKDDDKSVAMFKGFITTIENSNKGYKWNFDESTLVGKKLVGVFGLEQYEKQDGSTGYATKLTQFRSLDKLKEVTVPRVKMLDNTYVEYEEYLANKDVKTTSSGYVEFENGVTISEDLPF